MHTVDGYNEMVDALRDETGETYTFTAVLYPRYAVLEVPTGTNNRYQNFYWDGEELELQDIKGTTDDGQVDLSLVDPQQMIDMLNTVRDRLDNPETWYVIIGDYVRGQEAQISAYASNDFGESTYIVETLDGTVIYDSELEVQPSPAVADRLIRVPPRHDLARPPDRRDGRVRLRQVDRRRRAGRAAAGAVRGRRRPAPAGQHRQDDPRRAARRPRPVAVARADRGVAGRRTRTAA